MQFSVNSLHRLYKDTAMLFCLVMVFVAFIKLVYSRGHEMDITYPCSPFTVTAKCVLKPDRDADQILRGIVIFKQHKNKLCDVSPLLVNVRISGFDPSDGVIYHGIHVHQYGVHMTVDGNFNCDLAGSHYNPFGTNHGGPNNDIRSRHVGDFGNVVEGYNGHVNKSFYDHIASILHEESYRNILGRSFVVHEKRDDLGLGGNAGSLKTGNAGSRLACCTITEI